MNMENAFRAVLDSSKQGIYIVRPDRTILYWNKGAEAITGYTAADIVGRRCPDTGLKHIDSSGRPLCELNCPLLETAVRGNERTERVTVRRSDGMRVPIRTRFIPIRENGRVEAVAEVFEQISAEVYDDHMISTLSYELMHDKETGLPNKEYLGNFIRYKVSEFLLFNQKCAVLRADLNGIEDYVDEHGDVRGGELLAAAARHVSAKVRRSDVIGRWGKSEIIGVYMYGELEDLHVIGEKFRSLIKEALVPYKAEKLADKVAVGMTAIRQDDTVDSLVLRAEHMMNKGRKNPAEPVVTDLD